MIRRRINQGAIQGKRFQVSDVPDYSTPRGTSKSNDEMRKLAMDLTSFSQEVQGKIDEVKATIPPKTTTTTGGGTTTGPTETPKPPVLPVLEVWRDGNAIVVGTRIWDFTQSDTVRFEVNNLGNQRAQIKAHTLRTLNTMWGTFNGGYALEIPATPGGAINHPGYIPKISISQPFTVQKNRSLIHWVGDTASVEPALEAALNPSATPKTGFNSEKPAHELAAWTAYTQGITISGTAYDATTVKYRVTPNLTIFDPDNFNQTTQHVTRIFFKDSDTIKPHVRVDDPVLISSGVTDPRTYTAKIWLDIDDDAFTIENLGASGTNVGEVYKDKIDRTFYLRRLRTAGSLSLTEDDEYITISGAGGSGTGPIIDRLYNLPTDPTIPRLRVYSHTDVVSGSYYDHFLRGLWYEGNIDMYYDEYDRIVISGSENTYVDNCSSGVGTGQIFHELETLGRNRTFYLRKLLAGSGINITTEMHDVVISASGIDYAVDNCEESTGEGLIYHDETTANNTRTFHLRKLLAGSGIGVETTDHSIIITASGTPAIDIAIDNCELGSGTGLIYHDLTTSGTNTTFHLRRILAGSGIEVETIDHDVIVRSTVVDHDTKYDHLAVAHASGTLLRLHDSDDVNDDILFTSSGNTVNITRTSDDVINFEVNASGIRNVVGENTAGDCPLTGFNNFWYTGYTDDLNTDTRTLLFRKFGVLNDLKLTECGLGYGFSIGYTFENATTEGKGVWYDKSETSTGVYNVRFRGIRAGSGISVEYLYDDPSPGDQDIVISTSGFANSITKVDNVGIGAQILRDYTVSGNETTYHLRSIISDDQNYLYAVESNNEIRLGLYYDPEYIGIEDACPSGVNPPDDYGPHSLIDYVSGTGQTPMDRKFYGLKKISSTGYVVVKDEGCSIDISLSGLPTPTSVEGINVGSGTGDLVYNVYDGISGTNPQYLKFQRIQRFDHDNGVGVYITETNDTLNLSTRNANWNTSHSGQVRLLFIDPQNPGVIGAESVVTNLASTDANGNPIWHGLHFDKVSIFETYAPDGSIYQPQKQSPGNNPNVGVFSNRTSGTTPYWYFQPTDSVNGRGISDWPGVAFPGANKLVFIITVRLYLQGGNAIGQGLNTSIDYPQIALFRNNIFWRTLDVDMRVKDFNDLRQELLLSETIPISRPLATKMFLHGTAMVQLDDGDFVEVKYRHQSINAQGSGDPYNRRYHSIIDGSVDITRAGITTISQDANVTPNNFLL